MGLIYKLTRMEQKEKRPITYIACASAYELHLVIWKRIHPYFLLKYLWKRYEEELLAINISRSETSVIDLLFSYSYKSYLKDKIVGIKCEKILLLFIDLGLLKQLFKQGRLFEPCISFCVLLLIFFWKGRLVFISSSKQIKNNIIWKPSETYHWNE